MKPRARASRGFTLVEILIGSVVSSIILLGIVAAFIALQTAVTTEADAKAATEGARSGMEYLERVVRLAGYGIAPKNAFEMRLGPDYFPSGFNCGATRNNCADASGTFTTDDLAFRYRDPSFLRRGHFGTTGFSLQLESGTFGVTIPAGRRLIVGCIGEQSYIVLRTTAQIAAGSNSTSALAGDALSSDGVAPVSAPRCMQQTGEAAAYVMLLREVRVRIVDGMLVAFSNFTDHDLATSTNVAPLVQNVEDFQVAYVMNRPAPADASGITAPDGGRDWIFGNQTADNNMSDLALTAPEPTFDMDHKHPNRFNAHPANIRAVRISFVVATSGTRRTPQYIPPMSTEDHTVVPPPKPDWKYRLRLQTTISVPNMAARGFYLSPNKGG